MKDIECPECGHEQDIDHDDGYGYDEGFRYEQECSKCEKTFVFTTSISYYYRAHKAPCLNGSPHNLEVKFSDYSVLKKSNGFDWLRRESCRDCEYSHVNFVTKAEMEAEAQK